MINKKIRKAIEKLSYNNTIIFDYIKDIDYQIQQLYIKCENLQEQIFLIQEQKSILYKLKKYLKERKYGKSN